MLAEDIFSGLPDTLTSFVKNKDIQTAILELVNLPPDVIKNEPVKAAPLTKRYALVGTAFEIFILCRLYREFRKKCLNKIDFKIISDSAKKNKTWKESWKNAQKEIER